MKNLLLTMVLVAISSTAAAEQVVTLPETSHKWFLTACFSSKTSPTDQDLALAYALRTNPSLKTLVSQVIYTRWDNDDPLLSQSDWQGYLGDQRPAILLQTPSYRNGTSKVVYFAAGDNLNVDTLVQEISSALSQYQAENPRGFNCPRCPAPVPQPEPPRVTPIPTIVPEVPTVVQEPPVEDPEEESLLPYLISIVIGAGVALGKQLKSNPN
jgi:hypothetical protein